MNWKELMLAAFNEPFFNWKRTLSGIDIDNFRARYLDPATGCTVVVQCPEGECTGCDNHGLSICDLSSGITACCRHKYSGPKIPVSTQDLERYSLSYARFHADICRKLSLQFTNTPLGEFFWELGTYKVGTGRNLSVYISYHHTVKALTEQLHGLLSTAKKQFALLVYDYSMISRPAARLLEEHDCLCISMAELLSVEADGSLKRQATSEHIFDVYTKKEELGGRQTYSCSVGTKWSDIHINYHDGETLTIWKRGESPIAVSYVALGMVNEKNNMPNKGFKFLATTLMTGTQSLPVPAKTAVGYQALVQRKREINKSLKAFFPDIQDEDPIVFDSKNQCYQLRFKSRSI